MEDRPVTITEAFETRCLSATLPGPGPAGTDPRYPTLSTRGTGATPRVQHPRQRHLQKTPAGLHQPRYPAENKQEGATDDPGNHHETVPRSKIDCHPPPPRSEPPTTTKRDPTMNRDVRLLTITEVAERLSISVGTMRWRRHLGLPPHPIKVGRNLRYPETEVDAYIEALREAERKRRAKRETPQAERGAARSRAAW